MCREMDEYWREMNDTDTKMENIVLQTRGKHGYNLRDHSYPRITAP